MSTYKSAIAYLHASSPVHVGSGQSLDVIDLPIQRERGTGIPVVRGTAVKGVLRAECESVPNVDLALIRAAFGPGHQDDPSDGAGAVTFGDARLLLFPVRSPTQLFVWVTCPYLLRRYASDRKTSGFSVVNEEAALAAIARDAAGQAAVGDVQALFEGRVFVDDIDVPGRVISEIGQLASDLGTRCLAEAIRPLLGPRLVVLTDAWFGSVVRQCTEITPRIRLKQDTKTVDDGGLWYEEALPAESVLYSRILSEKARVRGLQSTAEGHLDLVAGISSAQFGGKASVGRGLCSVLWERQP